MKNTTVIGREGEDRACDYLIKNGYIIVDRNYHSRYGEIDIVAKKDNILAFVEVKTRKNTKYGRAAEYVDFRKQQKIIKTASLYLDEKQPDLQPRFDVIEVYINELNHIINAFECN